MYGNIIAICLLAMPVVALVAMACAWSPAEDDFWLRVWPTAWFPALWIAFWSPGFFVQGHTAINPFYFWIPLLSWLGVSLCCKLGKVRERGLAAILVLLVIVVAVPQLASDEWSYAARDRENPMALARLASLLRRGHRDTSNSNFRAGWIDRAPLDELWKPDQQTLRLGVTEQHVHSRVWHTWLTGLYRITSTPAGIWYPGGKPADAADRLEWRPRS